MTVFANAVLGPDGRPLDQIRLSGVTATGHHGVLEHERADGQEFRADVVLHLDTRPAAAGDQLAATVNYADVAQVVHDVLAGSPADLIETVAERVAAGVLDLPGVVAADVRIHKPQAPIPVPFDDVEVAIRRDQAKRPVVEPVAPPSAVEPVEPTPLVEPVETTPALVDAFAAHQEDRLDSDPPDAVEAVLAIGANLGDPQATLRAAVTDLDRLPGIQVMDVSPLARTSAVGGPEDQPDYLNAVLVVHTTLSPRALLRSTQAVENAHGRVREEHWGPRTLDVDIVRYGTLVADSDDLTIPHPRAHERAFVLVPWAELQPDADLPGLGGGPVAQLAETAPDRGGIRWLALDWLTAPAEHGTGSHPVAPSSEPVSEPVSELVPETVPEPVPDLPVPSAPHEDADHPEAPSADSAEIAAPPLPEAGAPEPAAPQQPPAPPQSFVPPTSFATAGHVVPLPSDAFVHAPVPAPPAAPLWPQGLGGPVIPASQEPPEEPQEAPAAQEAPEPPEAERTSVDPERWIPFEPDGGR